MFSKAKVGDRVWDFIEHWGTIIRIHDKSDFPLIIKFDNKEERIYKINGQAYGENMTIRLFWDEIKYEIPKKPFDLEEEFKKLRIKEFVTGEANYFLIWDSVFEIIDYDAVGNNEQPNVVYFTKESIDIFLNNIKDKKITKEEFFEAYKNVFGDDENERN